MLHTSGRHFRILQAQFGASWGVIACVRAITWHYYIISKQREGSEVSGPVRIRFRLDKGKVRATMVSF